MKLPILILLPSCTHCIAYLCTRHSDGRRILTSNVNRCNCDYVFGTDSDDDGFSNHVIVGNTTLIDIITDSYYNIYKQLRCDTIEIFSQSDTLFIGRILQVATNWLHLHLLI